MFDEWTCKSLPHIAKTRLCILRDFVGRRIGSWFQFVQCAQFSTDGDIALPSVCWTQGRTGPCPQFAEHKEEQGRGINFYSEQCGYPFAGLKREIRHLEVMKTQNTFLVCVVSVTLQLSFSFVFSFVLYSSNKLFLFPRSKEVEIWPQRPSCSTAASRGVAHLWGGGIFHGGGG